MSKSATLNFEVFGLPMVGATFSTCRKWRYSLWRVWDAEKPRVAFIGLNPSTADEEENDPTVRRCINYARGWGYGGMYMLNIFGIRATDPRVMKKAEDPIGPMNDDYILDEITKSELILCCWGAHGAHRGRSDEVAEMLKGRQLHCLGTTNAGEPKHPLYLKAILKPVRYRRW